MLSLASLLHVLFLSVVVVGLRYRYRKEPLATLFIPAFFFKALATIAYGWLYIVHYGGQGDSVNYFNDAYRLAVLAYEDPKIYGQIFLYNQFYPLPALSTGNLWDQPRAFTIVKIISLVNLFTLNEYWLTSLYFSFFSFWGMWKLANVLSTRFPKTQMAAAISFLFFPSVLLWSSGLSKESLVMASICFALAKLLKMEKVSIHAWKPWLVALLIWAVAIYLIWLVKFYYLAALLPCVISYYAVGFLYKKLGKKVPFKRISPLAGQLVLLLICLITLFVVALFLHPVLSPSYFMYAVVYNHNVTYIFSQPEDLIHYSTWGGRGYINLDVTLSNFLYNSPKAFFSALFRPFLWEVGDNKLKLVSGLENLFISIASLYAWIFLASRAKNRKGAPWLLIITTLLYVSVLYTLLALASPNFGSLARYKVAGAPFYIYLILIPIFGQLQASLPWVFRN